MNKDKKARILQVIKEAVQEESIPLSTKLEALEKAAESDPSLYSALVTLKKTFISKAPSSDKPYSRTFEAKINSLMKEFNITL